MSQSAHKRVSHQADRSVDAAIVVRLPAQLPVLTAAVSRALLALLVELTKVEVLERPPREGAIDDG